MDPHVATPGALVDGPLGAIVRSVVGDDDFLLDVSDVDGADPLDDLTDRLLFVVDGDDDRQLHGCAGSRRCRSRSTDSGRDSRGSSRRKISIVGLMLRSV